MPDEKLKKKDLPNAEYIVEPLIRENQSNLVPTHIIEDVKARYRVSVGAMKNEVEVKYGKGHELHPAYTILGSFSLVTYGFATENGSALGLFVLGFAASFFVNQPDTKKGKALKLIRNHPISYLLGGALAVMLFVGAGYPVPSVDYGLIMGLVGL